MEEAGLLKELVKLEDELGVNIPTIHNIPIWRIVRYHARVHYLTNKTGYIKGAPKDYKVGTPRLKLFSGFWRYLGKENLSVFFAFNRLANINGEYFDKFVDPVIEESDLLKTNFVIVDPRNYCGDYPRLHREFTVSNENRTLLCQLLKYYYRYVTPLLYGKEIKRLFNKVKAPFGLPDEYIKRFYVEVGNFMAYYKYYSLWFSFLNPKRVFVVLREGYFPQIAVCKKMNIPVAEFQHGITIDSSVSYAGAYDERLDPDYFLIFGEYWKGPQFEMPLDRIVNIGWAYKDYVLKKVNSGIERKDGRVLVVSCPEITNNILDTLTEFSMSKTNYGFDIRLHPCESMNENQKEKLRRIPKAQVVDNLIESAIALPAYKYVVGENSSVIYEALSLGCVVGMLNMCGMRPAVDYPGIRDNFFVINNSKDFESFLKTDKKQSQAGAAYYSDFNNNMFMNFINQSM